MTAPAPFRIARVRPNVGAPPFEGLPAEGTPSEGTPAGTGPDGTAEQFFVANHEKDFESARGRIWQVIDSPFPGSAANSNSPERSGWLTGSIVREEDFRFLAPCTPANVLGMAHNTGAPGRALPPQAFHKAATSVVGPGDSIELSSGVGVVEPEAELTVVVGRRCRHLTAANARTAVLGFTIGNDVTARDLQRSDDLWIQAKSQDTFTPLGPWIVVGLDDVAADIGIEHNGVALAPASTADLGWGVDEILVYLSSFMTLHPGDVVLTGFPAEGRPLRSGDIVSCRVGGIGTLTNPVAEVSAQ